MWSFLETVLIEQSFGTWYALVTLVKEGQAESFYLRFPGMPSAEEVDSAGVAYALQKNLEEAPVVDGDILTREEFFSRFTNEEIARIYRAAAVHDGLFAYVKRLEITPTINKKSPIVIAGLNLIESAGKLDFVGRAAEILR